MGSLRESAPSYAAIEPGHHHGHIHSADASPPTYATYPTFLPETFPIGRTKTTPVVSTDLLQAHLTILGAFDALHQKVRQVGANDPDAAWAVFLARAVYRFQQWVPCARFTDTEVSPMPPLDVLMVWHSYLLNPRIYYEDGLRVFPNLLAIPSFPLLYIATTISPITFLPDIPAHFHKSSWESQTLLPYEYTLITTTSETLDIPCPICEGEVMVSVAWITDSGTGFAQRNFDAHCEYCKQSFNREAMCVRKFCNDIIRVRESPSNHFFAGTLLNPVTGARSDADAKQLNERLISVFKTSLFKDETAAGLAQKLKFRLGNVRIYAAAGFRGILPQRIRRSLACYDDPSPFSVELTGAVLRQGSFIQKMVGLRWTAPGRFSGSAGDLNDVHVLVRCIARYHAFLDLMTSGVTFFVPTIDIDLAWHTHQLLNNKYTSDTTALIGRIPDHDDKVEENTLSNGYDITARAWKERFGVPYSVCGCAPISSGGVAQKITQIFKSKRGNQGGLTNPRPDLVSVEDADADATHPSEHNSVMIVKHPASEAKRSARQKKITKRMKELEEQARKGKLGEWEKLRAERMKREGHDTAFLMVVPYWGIAPYGFYGVGACAAYGGAYIDAGAGSCATGATGGSCSAGGCSSSVGACGAAAGGFGATGGCGGGAGCGGGGCGGGGGGCGG